MAPVVGDWAQFQTAFRFQLRSYLRTWRFVGLVVFVALISAALFAVQADRGIATVTGNYQGASDYLGAYLGLITDAIIITGALLGGDALAIDLSGGPGYLMLSQPVRRSTLLAGRYAAAAVTGAAIGLVYYAFGLGAVQYFYGSVPGDVVYSVLLAFLFLLAVLAVAFFFSSFFRSPTVSLVASVLILILAFPILTSVGDLTGAEPWYSLDYGSTAILSVLNTHFSHETVAMFGGRRGAEINLYMFSPYPWEGALIMAVYLGVFLALSYLIYRYKEVRG